MRVRVGGAPWVGGATCGGRHVLGAPRENLNQDPQLPYAEASFDRVLIVVSVQYLTQPVHVLRPRSD